MGRFCHEPVTDFMVASGAADGGAGGSKQERSHQLQKGVEIRSAPSFPSFLKQIAAECVAGAAAP